MTRQEMLDKIYGEINFPYDDGDAVYSPVMIGDVLDWMDKWEEQFWASDKSEILKLWKTKRFPLSSQNDDCIQYVYSLI